MKRRFVGGESVKNRDNKGKQQSNFRIPPELIDPTFPPVPTGFTGIGITGSTYHKV